MFFPGHSLPSIEQVLLHRERPHLLLELQYPERWRSFAEERVVVEHGQSQTCSELAMSLGTPRHMEPSILDRSEDLPQFGLSF